MSSCRGSDAAASHRRGSRVSAGTPSDHGPLPSPLHTYGAEENTPAQQQRSLVQAALPWHILPSPAWKRHMPIMLNITFELL